MLGKYQRCISCMKEVGTNNVCPYCGYIEGSPFLPDYLPPKTALNGRYLVGKLLGYNGEGATYIAFGTVIEATVEIREYMPDALCNRERNGTALVVNAGCETKYKALMSDFMDLMHQLTRMRTLTTVVRAYEVFEENNTAYAVLEHIEGVSLRQYLNDKAGEISWEEASKLFFPLFGTLSAIHGANLVHRGISPETILVNSKGEVKLTGFSISPLRALNTELSPQLFGGYAAPEQYSSNSWHGTWTDVYALAAVIYKSLTGTMPPEATTRSVNDNLIAPHILNPNIPKQVSNAIMAALVLSTEQRTQTMVELRSHLYDAEAPIPVPVASVPNKSVVELVEEEKTEKKGLPAWAIALIVTSIVLVVAFVVLMIVLFGGNGETENSSVVSVSSSDTTSETSSQLPASSKVTSIDVNDFAVEDFVKMSIDAVKNNPTFTSKYNFEIVEVWDESYVVGTIVKQEPAKDTAVKAHDKVKLYVSKGPQFVKVPSHQNMKLADYEAELSKKDIDKYQVVEEESDALTPGYIIRTNLDDGTYDRANTDEKQLIIYVSKEKPQISSEQSYDSSEYSDFPNYWE